MNEAHLDWSFYYHLWDQDCREEELEPFFRDPNIMYHHWNEVPHRFGLFAVNQEVRPQYFASQLVGKIGNRRLRAVCDAPDLRILGGRRKDGTVGVHIVNCGIGEWEDRVSSLRFSGLRSGRRSQVVYRVDRGQSWSQRALELLPTERREVHVQERFTCQVFTPGDSVTLAALEPGIVQSVDGKLAR